jgi:hypothetical protein
MADWIEQTETTNSTETTETIALPYSDNKMTWHPEKNRYILNEEAFRSYTGMDVRSMVNDGLGEVANIVRYYFDNVSIKVYNYIFNYRSSFARRDAALKFSPTAREMLYRCMIEQMVYFITNGDVSKFSGVNLKSGSVIERKFIQRATVSPDVIEILQNTPIPELGGVSILFAGIC